MRINFAIAYLVFVLTFPSYVLANIDGPSSAKPSAVVAKEVMALQLRLAVLDERIKQQQVQASLQDHNAGKDMQLLDDKIKKLSEVQQALKLELENLKTKLAAQGKNQETRLSGVAGRVSDISANTNMWGMVFSVFALIITIAALWLGFSAKKRAVEEAKKEANQASEAHVKAWLNDNKTQLMSTAEEKLAAVQQAQAERLEKIEQKAEQALGSIREQYQDELSELKRKSKAIVNSSKYSPQNANKTVISDTSSEDPLSPFDWFRQGLAAYQEENYKAAIEAWDRVVELSTPEEDDELQSMAMMNKGITQGQLGDSNKEIATYDSLIAKFADSENTEIQVKVAKTMRYKGIAQGQLGDLNKAIAAYDSLIAKFEDSDNTEIQVQVAMAMVNKGVAQGKLDDSNKEIATYDSLIAKFEDSDNTEIQVQVAMAMRNKGIAQGQLGDLNKAIATYDSLIAKFEDSDNTEIQVQVAMAIMNKGIAQGKLGDFNKEIATYDSLIAKFEDSDNTEIQVQVAMAMRNKGIAQGQLGDLNKAIATYDNLMTKFQDCNNAGIQNLVQAAWVGKIELTLLFESPEQVLHRLEEAERAIFNPRYLAVMKFLRYLIDDKAIIDVFTAIEAIPDDNEVDWQFAEIGTYLATFAGEKQRYIQAVVAFFEDHRDIMQLRHDLDLQSYDAIKRTQITSHG